MIPCSRREVLGSVTGLSLWWSTTLAGCLGDAPGTPSPGETATRTPTPPTRTATQTPAPTPTPSPTGAPPETTGDPTAPGEPVLVFDDGFEAADLAPWTTHGHVGEDAFGPFEWRIDRTSDRAFAGAASARLFTSGDHDDGTAWLAAPVAVDPGHAYDFDVHFRAYSESESFNTVRHVVAALGPDAPETEADFPAPGETSTGESGLPAGGVREPLDLSAGWREYGFRWASPVLSTERLWLAVGVSVVWETDRTDYLDAVKVTAARR